MTMHYLSFCIFFVLYLSTHPFLLTSPRRIFHSQPRTLFSTSSTNNENKKDPYDSFSLMDKILFSRFARSVHAEIGNDEVDIAQNYEELIRQISSMTYYFPADMVQEKGKNMLTKLFPSFLLPQYKILFSAPFPRFSAWMNAWVTHYATNWLMGNSTIFDLPLTLNGNVEEKLILKEQGLKIERCRFLESSGCISTCIGTCKIPTQRFFEEEMGLPVTLKPNVIDLSCIFEFGVKPLPLKMDRDLMDARCEDFASGILSFDESQNPMCKRTRNDANSSRGRSDNDGSVSGKSVRSDLKSPSPCLGGVENIEHDH